MGTDPWDAATLVRLYEQAIELLKTPELRQALSDTVAAGRAEADAAAAEQRALAALLAESREEVEAIAKEVAGAFPER